MKLRIIALVLLALFPVLTHAASATVRWTAPATASDGSPLTGAQAITSYQVWLSTSPIPTTTTAEPTATIAGPANTTTQTITAAPGATIYTRVKACSASACGAFSAEVSTGMPTSPPGIPTNVTITITVTP